jgi:hypothetical protein
MPELVGYTYYKRVESEDIKEGERVGEEVFMIVGATLRMAQSGLPTK